MQNSKISIYLISLSLLFLSQGARTGPFESFQSLLTTVQISQGKRCGRIKNSENDPDNIYTVSGIIDGRCESFDIRAAEFRYQYTAHQWVETEKRTIPHPEFGRLVANWLASANCRQRPQGCEFDINNDGSTDLLMPMAKGYRQGVPDTRVKPIVLTKTDGVLHYNEDISNQLPAISGGRVEVIRSVYFDKNIAVTAGGETVNNDTPRVEVNLTYGDLMVLAPEPELVITEAAIPETRWQSSYDSGRVTGVRTHSIASGDLNGDGMEDVLIGDYYKVFALMQRADIQFDLDYANYQELLWPEPKTKILTLDIRDIDGDGAMDIIAGYDQPYKTLIYYNDGVGGFSKSRMTVIPHGFYGDQGANLFVFIDDYDGDGDLDIVVDSVRHPYDGAYLRFLEQNNGTFIDNTEKFFGPPEDFPDIYYSWAMVQSIDVQGNQRNDFLRRERSAEEEDETIFGLFLNNGKRFEEVRVPLSGEGEPRPAGDYYFTASNYLPQISGDFDEDGILELLVMSPIRCWDCGEGETEIVDHYLNVYELRPFK